MKLGFSELIVILVVAMLVIGPDKLPYYARNLGKAVRSLRRELNQTTEEVRSTLDESMGDVMEPIRELKQEADGIRSELKSAVRESFDPFAAPNKAPTQSAEEGDASQEETGTEAEQPGSFDPFAVREVKPGTEEAS